MLKTLLFVSHTPYWFMRTYICLFLVAPMINMYLKTLSGKKRVALLASLCFIGMYLGCSRGDPSLQDGKNLANFLFLYTIGDTLRVYKNRWTGFNSSWIVAALIILNVVLIIFYLAFGSHSVIGKIIWNLSYPYCSPILLFNAMMVFMLIGKIHIQSIQINILASSTLTIYLIHSQPFVLELIGKVIPVIKEAASNEIIFMLLIICYALAIMVVSIGVDKLLHPIWIMVGKCGDKINCRLQKYY